MNPRPLNSNDLEQTADPLPCLAWLGGCTHKEPRCDMEGKDACLSQRNPSDSVKDITNMYCLYFNNARTRITIFAFFDPDCLLYRTVYSHIYEWKSVHCSLLISGTRLLFTPASISFGFLPRRKQQRWRTNGYFVTNGYGGGVTTPPTTLFRRSCNIYIQRVTWVMRDNETLYWVHKQKELISDLNSFLLKR